MSTTFKTNVQDATINNALTVDTNTLYVDPVNNGVCIGTTTLTSGYKLTVAGKADFSDIIGLAKIATGSLPTASSYEGHIAYDDTLNKFVYSNGSSWIDPTSGGGGMSIGGTVTSGTTGSILFVGSGPVLAQDNSNFFWDDSNNFLGIGTATPASHLHIFGAAVAAQSTGYSSGISIGGSYTKNNGTSAQYYVHRMVPTFNFGGSNANTTVDVLSIDTTNTSVTGTTINLISAKYGASEKFKVSSDGATTVAGQLTVGGGAVVGTEIGGLVPGDHLMQINATGTTAPLLISGGAAHVQMWDSSSLSTAAAGFGLARPGDAAGTDLKFSTYRPADPIWRSRLSISAVDGLATFAASATVTNNLTVDTDSLYVDATNHRVGIGTTGPTRALSVVDTVAGTGLVYVRNNSTTGYSETGWFDSGGTKYIGVGRGNSGVGSPFTDLPYITWTDTLQFVASFTTSVTTLAQTGLWTITPTAVTTAADQFVSGVSLGGSYTKNDANTRQFYVNQIRPTFNFGGSNNNTTVDILSVDSVNTSVTGATINLARFKYGGTEQFKVNSAGDISNNGSTTFKTSAITSTTTAGSQRHIFADATSGAFTVNLPTASGIAGREYVIHKTDSSVNSITVDPNASETIDGITTATIAVQYGVVRIVSDGTNWLTW